MASIPSLLTAAAVRERANRLLELGVAGKLDHFAVDLDRLPTVADFVIDTARESYPDLDIPFHSRWRHFEAGRIDRFGGLIDAAGITDPIRFGRTAYDLAIVSVLLDAGAGPDWRYHEAATGETYSRSEGLGVASFAMFASGLFSQDPADPLRADAAALAVLDAADLAEGFQVTAENPMVGLDGRARLLNALGRVVADRPDLFGTGEARPGGLFDAVLATADADGRVSAPRILELVLEAFGPIWPGRLLRDGVALGDTFEHRKLVTDDATAGLMPFHKLSQWLTYSLIEPLIWTGVEVIDLDGLTGLPEYRNGGLFLDLGVLVPKDASAVKRRWKAGDEFIVEWRALTVALLDRTARLIRDKLGLDADSLPLAKVLEGGTWSAGRRIAREKRADGVPPLTIESDGTVF
ncbi:URC4/urg3 family protein [Kaistia nematophila]|uniref:URC4/urg3 family protein n=1 Tax=Kaistia nematophila TaxID=2994654 RepID=A0A9X3DY85_9HYPH|nr:URC4/urg3 family protein [Kaistia nematophila]MCX5567927.1 URC4/urg3 family protein [Kaistia nematophila]